MVREDSIAPCSWNAVGLYIVAVERQTQNWARMTAEASNADVGEKFKFGSVLFPVMGTNYKAALIQERIRETIHGWGKDARRMKRRLGIYTNDSIIHTDRCTVMSVEEYDDQVDR